MAVGAPNKFYIEPSKADITPVLKGIGSMIKDSRDADKRQKNKDALLTAYKGGNPDDVAALIAENPELAGSLNTMLKFKSDKTAKGFSDTVRGIALDPDNAEQILIDRIEMVNEQGGNPVQSVMALDQFRRDPDGFNNSLLLMGAGSLNPQEYDALKIKMGVGKGGNNAGIKSFAPVTIVNPTTKEKRLVAPTVNPNTGQTQLSPFDMPEGFEISKETDEEKRTANVLAKGKEVMAKGAAKRAQSSIDDGYSAANAIPTVSRAIKLLGEVETGGFDNVALRVKQAFGVEGANEGELSNLLGKSVLSQLKPTFGAAFTAEEGKALTRIEAGFGKNPRTNLRLLKNALKLYERTANQAIKRAEKAGDMDTVKELQDAMNFSLDEDQPQAIPSGVTEDDILETMKANNMTREQVLQRLSQ